MMCPNRHKIFNPYLKDYVEVDCGRCVVCSTRYSAEWALRNALERRQHKDAFVATLTYDDDHLPECGLLVRSDVQNFLKRLRKKYSVRYFGCGEYGSKYGRPHYHLIIYGYIPSDLRAFGGLSTSGKPLYTSAELSRIWKKGLVTVDEFSERAATYCARYLTKQRVCEKSIPPFTMMSLKPSIGYASLGYDDLMRGYFYYKGKKRLLPRSFLRTLERKGIDVSEQKARRASYYADMSESERQTLEKNSLLFIEKTLDKLHQTWYNESTNL